MRFLVHGTITPEGQLAMIKHEQALHTVMELAGDGVTDATLESPEELLKLLAKKQWNLFTTDGAFVEKMYEQHVEFPGVVVLLLDDPAVLDDQAPAVDRLFERYKRLTPRRLYTITPSKVKIRQLPGAAQAD